MWVESINFTKPTGIKSSSVERKVAAVQYNDSGETEKSEIEGENKYRKSAVMVEIVF